MLSWQNRALISAGPSGPLFMKQPNHDRRMDARHTPHRPSLFFGSGYRGGNLISQRASTTGAVAVWDTQGAPTGPQVGSIAVGFYTEMLGPFYGSGVVQLPICNFVEVVGGVGTPAGARPMGAGTVSVVGAGPYWVNASDTNRPLSSAAVLTFGPNGQTPAPPLINGPQLTLPEVALEVWRKLNRSDSFADLNLITTAAAFCASRGNFYNGPVEPDRFDAWISQAAIGHELIAVRGLSGWGFIPAIAQPPTLMFTSSNSREVAIRWGRANDKPRGIAASTPSGLHPIAVGAESDDYEFLYGLESVGQLGQAARALATWLQLRSKARSIYLIADVPRSLSLRLKPGDSFLLGAATGLNRGEFEGSVKSVTGAGFAPSWAPIILQGYTAAGSSPSRIESTGLDFALSGVSVGDFVAVGNSLESFGVVTSASATGIGISQSSVSAWNGKEASFRVYDATPPAGARMYLWGGTGKPIRSFPVSPQWDAKAGRVIYTGTDAAINEYAAILINPEPVTASRVSGAKVWGFSA